MIKNQNLFDATRAAFAGLGVLLKEKAFWRELGLLVIAVIIAVLRPSPLSFGLVAVSILILAAEALNTAIEKLCDMIQPEFDLRIKDIKDLAAAGIFLLLVLYAALLIAVLADGFLLGA